MGAASIDAERSQIREFWNEMVQEMGQRDMDRFLRHLWVSRFGDLKSQDLFSALKTNIENNSISAVEFARSCADECDSYVSLLDASADTFKETARPLKSLVRQLNFQVALPLLLSAHKYLPLQDLDALIRLLLVFVTRQSVVSNQDPSEAESLMFSLAMEVRGSLVSALEEKRKNHARSEGIVLDSGDVKQTLTFVKSMLRNAAPTDEVVKGNGADLVLGNDEAKYVLGRLAAFLQTDTKELTIDEANLEHIFPQRAKEPEWSKEQSEQLEPYIWHLGNLTILGTRLNRTAGNKSFETKRKHYQQKSELKMAQDVGTT
ncbi:MAG: HNH endonuclease family protein [Janthinobacterium lividum]